MTPTPPEPGCTCGHPEADHYAGTAYCKRCGADVCPRFTPTAPTLAPPDDADDWELVAEFHMAPDLHATLDTATAMRLRLLHHPPRTEAEIVAAVTTFATIKDKEARLRQLLDDLVAERRIPNRQVLLAALLAGLHRFVNWLDEYGRISQSLMAYQEWEPWMNALRIHLYKGLAMVPGNDLAVALVQVLRLLDDRTQWPQFARAHDEDREEAPPQPAPSLRQRHARRPPTVPAGPRGGVRPAAVHGVRPGGAGRVAAACARSPPGAISPLAGNSPPLYSAARRK